MTCPNPNDPLFKFVKDIYGEEMAFYIYEYIENTTDKEVLFDPETGAISINNEIVYIKKLVDEFETRRHTLFFEGKGTRTALENVKGPLAPIAALLKEKVTNNRIITLEGEVFASRDEAEASVIRKAIIQAISREKGRQFSDLFKIARARLKGYGAASSTAFMEDVLLDQKIQSRVKNLPKKRLWEGVVRELTAYLNTTPDVVTDLFSLDLLTETEEVKTPLTIRLQTSAWQWQTRIP